MNEQDFKDLFEVIFVVSCWVFFVSFSFVLAGLAAFAIAIHFKWMAP